MQKAIIIRRNNVLKDRNESKKNHIVNKEIFVLTPYAKPRKSIIQTLKLVK